MSDISATFLHKGKSLISGALTGFSTLSIYSFKVGDTAGFTPSPDEVDIRGNKVFTGYPGLVQSKQIEDDTVRHTLVIPENAGPFTMGNVFIYAYNLDGIEVPFMAISFPFAVKKIRSDPQLDNSLSVPTPGTRFVINVEIKHSIFGEVLAVNVVSPEYSSLAFFDTESSVPPSNINPHNQFVVNRDTRVGAPVLVSKKSDGSLWGTPLNQDFRSPKFGILDGGNSGDNYLPNPIPVLSGALYTTDTDEFGGQIGGMPYNHEYNGNVDSSVGGTSYGGEE